MPPRTLPAATARALLLLTLPAALGACDGTPLSELNRGLPTVLTLVADTSAFDQASPGAPLQLAVRATDPYGDAVAAVPVVWDPVAKADGTVDPDTSRTDADGMAQGVWTLGTEPGLYRLRVFSFGVLLELSATVR